MKKRIYQDEVEDIDRKLLSGLHHVEWRERGESADHTKYKIGVLKEKERKKIHKVTVA